MSSSQVVTSVLRPDKKTDLHTYKQGDKNPQLYLCLFLFVFLAIFFLWEKLRGFFFEGGKGGAFGGRQFGAWPSMDHTHNPSVLNPNQTHPNTHPPTHYFSASALESSFIIMRKRFYRLFPQPNQHCFSFFFFVIPFCGLWPRPRPQFALSPGNK